MWKSLFRKNKAAVMEPGKMEEILQTIQTRYEENQKDIRYRYEASARELQRYYEEKIDEGRLYEKELSFHRILDDAEKGLHPFEYTVERGSIHYTKMTFFRSKQSPNPFRILIEVHKNCIFLGVTKGEREKIDDNLITLYYDKVKKVYQEYQWDISYDYATKHHMRMFLYDMMKHVKNDELHHHSYYKSEFRARDEFWEKEHLWKAAYEQQCIALREKRDQEYVVLKEAYEREVAPYLLEIEELEKKNLAIEAEKQKKEHEQKQRLLEKEKNEQEQVTQLLSGRVFDVEVDMNMRRVYQYAQRLLEKEVLLDIEQAHELRRLYEKDLQELWRSFIQLEEKKQIQEKTRFQTLLLRLEAHLNTFEERMLQMEQLDYEKKMTYMEKKYLG